MYLPRGTPARTLCNTLSAVTALVMFLTTAHAQTYTVLHNFTNGQDGAEPFAGLTMDKAGSLYGTALGGGKYGSGTVYKLIHKGTNWTFNPLYSFAGGDDGAAPTGGLTIGPDGSLYGTTFSGGQGNCTLFQYRGCGTVFSLKPGPSACKAAICEWSETQLYSFTGDKDGADPYLGSLVFDQAGNIYGTTFLGGAYGPCFDGLNCGTIFKLTPESGGKWQESVIWDFGQKDDGEMPANGVIFDQVGNLYGTTALGGTPPEGCKPGNGACGTVYELMSTSSGWTEKFLKQGFQPATEGAGVYAGVVFDQLGNLYGAATADGKYSGGTVFELTPSGDSWTFSVDYALAMPGAGNWFCSNCTGPYGTLILDAAGNLYGTAFSDGLYQKGTVFELTPSSDGQWMYTSLHDFCASGPPCVDGAYPYGSLVFDASGNVYGTASAGGSSQTCSGGCGVVFKITPNN
jgi:uncharacterized repeat protein (TIGR03803 family)